MLIAELASSQFPLFIIETLHRLGHWQRFVDEPFLTEASAEAHRKMMLEEYKTPPDRVRVAPYTVERWRDDLIGAMLEDKGALRRALSLLCNETLADY